jgi:hypothetical protein
LLYYSAAEGWFGGLQQQQQQHGRWMDGLGAFFEIAMM